MLDRGKVLKNGYEKDNLVKKHFWDAGLDIRSNQEVAIPAKGKKTVTTGLKIAVPQGYVGLLYSRSGLSHKYGIEVGAGVIDSGFRGEVMVVLYNHSNEDFIIRVGDRIAQLLTIPVSLQTYLIVNELPQSDRGEKGYGSSGIQ